MTFEEYKTVVNKCLDDFHTQYKGLLELLPEEWDYEFSKYLDKNRPLFSDGRDHMDYEPTEEEYRSGDF